MEVTAMIIMAESHRQDWVIGIGLDSNLDSSLPRLGLELRLDSRYWIGLAIWIFGLREIDGAT